MVIVSDKMKIILILIGALVLIFLGNYLFAKKYIQPKIVEDAVTQIQKNIEESYAAQKESIDDKIRNLDNKINLIETRRKQIAKDVEMLKKARAEYKPPANLEEAVKELRRRGYEVTIR